APARRLQAWATVVSPPVPTSTSRSTRPAWARLIRCPGSPSAASPSPNTPGSPTRQRDLRRGQSTRTVLFFAFPDPPAPAPTQPPPRHPLPTNSYWVTMRVSYQVTHSY